MYHLMFFDVCQKGNIVETVIGNQCYNKNICTVKDSACLIHLCPKHTYKLFRNWFDFRKIRSEQNTIMTFLWYQSFSMSMYISVSSYILISFQLHYLSISFIVKLIVVKLDKLFLLLFWSSKQILLLFILNFHTKV